MLCCAAVAVAPQLACASFGSAPTGERLARLRQSSHHNGAVFVNPARDVILDDDGRGEREVDGGSYFFADDHMGRPTCALPLPDPTTTKQTLAVPPPSGLRVTWLGHSTTLVEIDGVRVLTDPQFSELASPVPVGPSRFHPPPLPLADVPAVDVVVVSHDHYDHLDMETVQRIAALWPKTRFFVPLGIGAHLERWDIARDRFVEFDWGDRVVVAADGGGVAFVSTPSHHFSGRALIDYGQTLWTSWAIVGPRHRVWFSGDTGLTKQFEDIGRDLGPFDVALVEVGQWDVAWGGIHLGPRGALRTADMVRARRLFPVHWGTFNLGLHDWNEPIETTVTLAARRGVDVITPRLGVPTEPDRAETSAWWRSYPPTTTACP